MEVINPFIFQIDSPLVHSTLEKCTNMKIEYSNEINFDPTLCVIYFSSNEIYYPNTEGAFNFSIVKRDKYEWRNSKFPTAYKHIFLRDIKKQWYIEGINSKVNTPQKLKELLLIETKGFRVFTIGSSAGGFAAIVYGSLISADRVYAFNAQLNLFNMLENSTSLLDPLLYKYRDSVLSYYYTADSFIQKNTRYFYFQSAKSHMDIDQYNLLEKKELFTRIQFNTSNHGFPILRHNINHILLLSLEELEKLSLVVNHPFIFSVKADGPVKAIYLLGKAILKRIKKKYIDEKINSK